MSDETGQDYPRWAARSDGRFVGDAAEQVLVKLAEKHRLPAPSGYNPPGEYIARSLLVMLAELGLLKGEE